MHPQLECDGHPQCDNAADEKLDVCHDKLLKEGRIKDDATVSCLSRDYHDTGDCLYCLVPAQ